MNYFVDNIYFIILALVSGGMLLFTSLKQVKGGISQTEAIQLMNRGKATILDVRKPEEFAKEHLNNAKNVPVEELANRLSEFDKLKEKNIVIVCQTGARAMKAESLLKKAGFTHVHTLKGGMKDWQAQNLPTVA